MLPITAWESLQSLSGAHCYFWQDRQHPSGGASSHKPPEAPLPVAPDDPLDDSPAPDRPMREVSVRKTDVHLLQELCRAQQWRSAVVSYHDTPRAILCRYWCRLLLAEISDGCDRNEELKRRRQTREAGEVHDLNEKVLGQKHIRHQAAGKRHTKLQTEEQRGKRASAFTARGSTNKAMKGWLEELRRARQNTENCRPQL